MNTQSEIRQKLRHSLDMTFVRIKVTIYICLLILGAILGLLHPSYRDMPFVLPICVVIFALCGLVFLVPALLIWFHIYREPAGYRFYKTTLRQPHGGFPRGFMYFTVLLEEPDGAKFVVNTNTIFQSYGTSFGLGVEDYVNQEVTIAYNEDTEAVVVIG